MTLPILSLSRYDRVNMYEYDARDRHRGTQKAGYTVAGIGAAVMLAGIAPSIGHPGIGAAGAGVAVVALAVVALSAYRLARTVKICEATREALTKRSRRQDQERREAEARSREEIEAEEIEAEEIEAEAKAAAQQEIREWRAAMVCSQCGTDGRSAGERDIPDDVYDVRTAGEWLESHDGLTICDQCGHQWWVM